MGLARCVAHCARTVRHQVITSTPSYWKLDQAPPYWKEFAQHMISFNAFVFLISETKRLALTTNVLKSTLRHMQHLYNKNAERYCIRVARDVESMYQTYTGPFFCLPPDDEEATGLRDCYLEYARRHVEQVQRSKAYNPRWVEFASPAESSWSFGEDGYLSPEED